MPHEATKMKNALSAVKKGMSLRQASVTFGVARSTIHAHLNKRKVDELRLEKSGRLSESEEQRLTNWFVYCHYMGFGPITNLMLRQEAANLSKSSSGLEQKFNKEWCKYFRQKHNSVKIAMGLYKNCQYFDQMSLENWFRNLTEYCQEQQLECLKNPQHIFYCCKLHITENYKIILSFSASGMATPPLLIAANLKDSEKSQEDFDSMSLPRGWVKYNCENVPYHQDQENIYHYYLEHVLKSFISQNGIDEPILLFLNSESHLPKVMLYELFRNLKVYQVNSYPTSFKLQQTLQTAILDGLKNMTHKKLSNLLDLIKSVLMNKLTKEEMTKTFLESGIYPLDITKIQIDLLPKFQPKIMDTDNDSEEEPEALKSCLIEHIDTGELSTQTSTSHKSVISLEWQEFCNMLDNEIMEKLQAANKKMKLKFSSPELEALMKIYRKFSSGGTENNASDHINQPLDDDPLSGTNTNTNMDNDVHVDLWE